MLWQEEKEAAPAQESRALEDEPLLAARMVIEDCMCLLLDVDDIDRLWAAGDILNDLVTSSACALCRHEVL